MKVKYAQLLELFECGDRQVLCRINVKPRCVEFYYGQPAYATHRWMQPEHWALFDKGLQQVMTEHKERLGDEKWETHFQLNALIRVNVRKSRVAVELLGRCMNETGIEEKHITHALDCTIAYEEVLQTKETKEVYKKAKTKRVFQDLEYEPQYVSSQTAPTSRESTASPLVYIPYTPSSKADSSHSSNEANSITEVAAENFEDPMPEPYSPKPLDNASPEETNHPLEVPTYNPMRIADIQEQKKDSKKPSHRDGKRRDKSSSHRKDKRTDNSELKEDNKRSSSKEENKHKKPKHERHSEKSEKFSASSDDTKLSVPSSEIPESLTRTRPEMSSGASSDAEIDRPSKRTCPIEQKSNESKKSKSQSAPPRKHSHKRKQIELFGSDDDELL